MTFKEFLEAHKHLPRPDVRDAARAHPVIVGRIIEATSMNSLASELDVSADIKRIAESPDHPARHKMTSVYTGLLGNHPFNFIAGSFAGDKAIAQLDWLIDHGLSDEPVFANKLVILQAHVMQMANVLTYPWKKVTLHDVLLGYGECDTSKKVAINGRQAVIELTGEFEPHKPRLMAQNIITGKWQRINNFANADNSPCAVEGVYACAIPPQFSGWALEVDDPYGAVL